MQSLWQDMHERNSVTCVAPLKTLSFGLGTSYKPLNHDGTRTQNLRIYSALLAGFLNKLSGLFSKTCGLILLNLRIYSALLAGLISQDEKPYLRNNSSILSHGFKQQLAEFHRIRHIIKNTYGFIQQLAELFRIRQILAFWDNNWDLYKHHLSKYMILENMTSLGPLFYVLKRAFDGLWPLSAAK